MIAQAPAAVGLCRHPCVGSRGAEIMSRKRGLRAAKSTSGPVGVEVRWYWLQDAVWILNVRLCKGCFSRLGRQVTHPKLSSYVKANPELEKQKMNLLLWAGEITVLLLSQMVEAGLRACRVGFLGRTTSREPSMAAWGRYHQLLWDGGRLAEPPT